MELIKQLLISCSIIIDWNSWWCRVETNCWENDVETEDLLAAFNKVKCFSSSYLAHSFHTHFDPCKLLSGRLTIVGIDEWPLLFDLEGDTGILLSASGCCMPAKDKVFFTLDSLLESAATIFSPSQWRSMLGLLAAPLEADDIYWLDWSKTMRKKSWIGPLKVVVSCLNSVS